MAMRSSHLSRSWLSIVALLAFFLSACPPTLAASIRWIEYTGEDGVVYLNDDRKPALYTQDFGDCAGSSLITVSRFDAAYYADNMTVLFHLGGSTLLTNESLMMQIGVYAYGENRFQLTFNPCNANINSLCPLNSSVPIEASGIIPVAQSDVAGIPALALTIPDFEGQAILRIFANSTESQIACFSAIVTNGSTFSHPAAVGTILGLFTIVALISSVAAAIYGHHVPETRTHYAHSLSVWVVFSVFQHIYYTGGLSMNWPSVLVAFWSNYAWSAGMIYGAQMQASISRFIGSDGGNISVLGSAPTGENEPSLGGGYQISQIYKRAMALRFESFDGIGTTLRPREFEHALARRDLVNSSTGFAWYGSPVKAGLPLPGNYSGFAGTLAVEDIPASNAFLTGFLWLLILIVILAAAAVSLKWAIEALARAGVVRTTRLAFFRQHWISFTVAFVLRTCYIGFFPIMFLTMFQFTLGGPAGVRAIAGVVFIVFLVGMFAVVGYALYYRLRVTEFHSEPDRLVFTPKKVGFIPWYSATRASTIAEKDGSKEENKDDKTVPTESMAWRRYHFTDKNDGQLHVHDDEDYYRKFGWLSSRFRRSKWWFFAAWLVYELIRAAFYGGAAGHALTQVFGLLAVEIIALLTIVLMRPFESNRLNLLMVYLLGFSKVATVALASAFDIYFELPRILTTVLGIVIIVIQGVLTICLLVAIVLGAISSYVSITRFNEDFKPQSGIDLRERYFVHIEQKATDRAAPPPPVQPVPEAQKEPYFNVSSVRREPKIEDEDVDPEDDAEVDAPPESTDPDAVSQKGTQLSRTNSVRSRMSHSNLPYGARPHRPSWSSREISNMMDGNDHYENTPSGVQSRISNDSIRTASLRTPSMKGTPVRAHSDPSRLSSDKVKKHRRATLSREMKLSTEHIREDGEMEQ